MGEIFEFCTIGEWHMPADVKVAAVGPFYLLNAVMSKYNRAEYNRLPYFGLSFRGDGAVDWNGNFHTVALNCPSAAAVREILNDGSCLSEREAQILILMFGLMEDDQPRRWTGREVEERFSISRQRVSAIKIRALRKLRHPSQLSKLIPLYLGELDRYLVNLVGELYQKIEWLDAELDKRNGIIQKLNDENTQLARVLD